MKTSEERLSLDNVKGGAAIELFNMELQAILDDIADPNKQPDAAREVNLKMVIKPDEEGNIGNVGLQVKSKLAPVAPVFTKVVLGSRAGKGEARELISTQQTLFPGDENVIPMERNENDKRRD